MKKLFNHTKRPLPEWDENDDFQYEWDQEDSLEADGSGEAGVTEDYGEEAYADGCVNDAVRGSRLTFSR